MANFAGIMIGIAVFLVLALVVAPIIVLVSVTSRARRTRKNAEKTLRIRK